jgi:hypothetical protein
MILLTFFFGRMSAQVVRIRFVENKEYCSGFEPANSARVRISTVPNIRIPENSGAVYTWYAVHKEGFRSWHTPVDAREIPLPWPGVYEIYVVMKYIDKATLRPYFAFKSASIFATAQVCPP